MMLKQHPRLLGAAVGLAASAVLVSADAAGASGAWAAMLTGGLRR
jgi:hypothetical protein